MSEETTVDNHCPIYTCLYWGGGQRNYKSNEGFRYNSVSQAKSVDSGSLQNLLFSLSGGPVSSRTTGI